MIPNARDYIEAQGYGIREVLRRRRSRESGVQRGLRVICRHEYGVRASCNSRGEEDERGAIKIREEIGCEI